MMKRFCAVVAAICAVSGLSATAQKLPDVQETGFRAPAGIKIDGKSGEWADSFQAYNKNNQLYYTVANDDQNLYLVVQASNRAMISKIIRGGLTLTINVEAKKKEKDAFSVTFPVATRAAFMNMMQSMRGTMEKMRNGDQATMMKQADSMMYAMNRQQIDGLKDVKVKGIKDIPDSILSIYNEEGIKVRALFDQKGSYNYELALPLKYLGLTPGKSPEFTYNIKLPGLLAAMTQGGGQVGMGGVPAGGVDRVVVSGGGMGGGGMAGPVMMSGNNAAMADMMAMMSSTDFWGKYTLKEK